MSDAPESDAPSSEPISATAMKVVIKYLSGQQRTFTVEPTDTIGSLVEVARAHDIVAELSDEPKPFKLACWALRVRELDVNQTFEACGIQAFATLSQLSHVAPISAAELKAFQEAAAKRCLAHDGQMCRELLRRVANHECNESDYVLSKEDVDSANRMAGVDLNTKGTRSLSEMHPKEIKRWHKRNPGKKFRQPAPVYVAAIADVA